jgi:hypothetical protein
MFSSTQSLPSSIFSFQLYTTVLCVSTRSQILAITPSALRINNILKMTSYLSRLSPVPCFDEYTGPHKVGTIDVELPVSELEAPSPPPAAGESIPTIQYRIFYPCEPDAKGKSINWLPAPQRGYVSAYTRFLGAGSMLADFIS